MVPAEENEEELTNGKKADIYWREIKITMKIEQVASHHSIESLSFWNHTKDNTVLQSTESYKHSTLNRNTYYS